MNCRHCQHPLENVFVDLGFAPPSNAYLTENALKKPEIYFPLKVYVCKHCWLVQTEDYSQSDELFTDDYAYFSSTSKTWLEHASRYSSSMIRKLKLGPNSHVVEVAANDGYLLKNFIQDGIPCLGIEPTNSTADAAEQLGIPVVREFFGVQLAQKLSREGKQADLVIGNNVYAHVPDINDFTKGLKLILKDTGTITLEFPHLQNLLLKNQFDTIYHEHYSYLSLYTVNRIFSSSGLKIYDVERLPTHGGSLRIYACHAELPQKISARVTEVLQGEKDHGLQRIATYNNFQPQINRIKDSLLDFLLQCKKDKKSIIAYGAAAKGNTLLNYAGIKTDLLSYVCDAAQSKQDKYMPGSHIPIASPDLIATLRPDFVLVLPWNIADEVMHQNEHIRGWGGQFVTVVPEITIR